MSRAACSASVASAACSEPTCLCASPLRLRMKTSHKGVFGVAIIISSKLFGGLRDFSPPAFLGVGLSRLAHPGAFVVVLAPRRKPIPVAGAVAGQHPLEFVPVDRAVFPMPIGVLRHAGIGNRKSQKLRLRHRRIDELLAQLVVGEPFYLPFGRGVAVLRSEE